MLIFRKVHYFGRTSSLSRYVLTAFIFCFFHGHSTQSDTIILNICEPINSNVTEFHRENIKERPFPVLEVMKLKRKRNKRITAAVLAFPIPFGIVGLHRIYLGTAPYVPVVYVASLGGVLGILPFIDFCVLILDKDPDRYLNNKKVFMWVNQ